jgi:coproporphyrinogen III oxidase
MYLSIKKIGVKTIVVAFSRFKEEGSKLLAQYVENIGVINTYNPNKRGMNTGSGTWISNVNLASFEKVGVFFNNVFGIDMNAMKNVEKDIESAFKC